MTSRLDSWVKSFKKDTRFLGMVERHLLGIDPWEHRRKDVIHPSELVVDEWCPRAVYYRMSGVEPHTVDPINIHREVIFEEGHEYHRKWQGWAWDLGVLKGMFRCHSCGNLWEYTAPIQCPRCDAGRGALEYREVPATHEELRIGGSADGILALGDDGEPLLEVKSIGEGTVRWYEPRLLGKHTYEVTRADGSTKKLVDMNGVWRAVRRPFGSHIKQVTLYGYCLGITDALIVYENKANGQHKEFNITLDFSLIEHELEECRDLVYALKVGKPPPCPKEGGCKWCKAYEHDGESDDTDHESEQAGGTDTGRRARAGQAGERGPSPSEQADVRPARGWGGVHRGQRPGPDGADAQDRSLEGVRERAPRRRSDRGRGEGEDPAAPAGQPRRRVVRRARDES